MFNSVVDISKFLGEVNLNPAKKELLMSTPTPISETDETKFFEIEVSEEYKQFQLKKALLKAQEKIDNSKLISKQQ